MILFIWSGDTSITQLVVPITIDGVNSDKTYNFGTENKYCEMTYEKFRA